MSDLAYIVAPRRKRGVPALAKALAPKALAPLQGSNVCVWFDRWNADMCCAGLNRDYDHPVWAVYAIHVTVEAVTP